MFESHWKWAVVLVIVLWNIITFIMMKIDKSKAEKSKWRIKEKTIFLSAFFNIFEKCKA